MNHIYCVSKERLTGSTAAVGLDEHLAHVLKGIVMIKEMLNMLDE